MFLKKTHKKQEYKSNSPLKKTDFRGNILEDESNLQSRTKQSIESKENEDINVSAGIENSTEEHLDVDQDNDIEYSDLSEEIDNIDVGSPLKKLLKSLKQSLKKKKKQQVTSFLNNDRAPSLGNEGMSESTLSKSEQKKKKSILSSISNAIIRNKALRNEIRKEAQNLKDVSVSEINEQGIQKSSQIKQEHTQQLADAINDIGESNKKGRWADALSDSNIKSKSGGGIGR